MSDKKGRRRFLADLLFAGGAVTAASVLGYTATHWPAPSVAAATPTPVVTASPVEVMPAGKVAPRDPMQRPGLQPEGESVAPRGCR